VEQGKGYIAKQALRDKVSYLVHDLVWQSITASL
jgi:hypothetical protein